MIKKLVSYHLTRVIERSREYKIRLLIINGYY